MKTWLLVSAVAMWISPLVSAQLVPVDWDSDDDPDTEESTTHYDRALPFMAQDVLDLGYELPLPYGAMGVFYWQEQDLILDKLEISVNDGPVQEIDFVDFGTPSVENITGQFKLDAWLFPFMNIYATLGKFDGDGTIPLAIEGRDLLEFLGFDRICSGQVLEPEFCSRILTAIAKPEYKGSNIVLGTTLAGGWNDFFVAIPISYVWSEVNIINETVTALNITPRLGYLKPLQGGGSIAVYTGATYLDAEVDLTGTVSFDTSGSELPDIPDQTTIDFKINQRNKDKWNYLVGLNWEINQKWSIQSEIGFGGSRTNFITSASYRW